MQSDDHLAPDCSVAVRMLTEVETFGTAVVDGTGAGSFQRCPSSGFQATKRKLAVRSLPDVTVRLLYNSASVSGGLMKCRLLRQPQDIKHKYSDTSANEDKSFRNHIR